jgi:DNA-directed RNA polymerase subunit RPC12/RpoP
MKTTQIDTTCHNCGARPRDFTLQAFFYAQIWRGLGSAVEEKPATRIIEIVCNKCGNGTLLKFRVDEMDEKQFQAIVMEAVTDENES